MISLLIFTIAYLFTLPSIADEGEGAKSLFFDGVSMISTTESSDAEENNNTKKHLARTKPKIHTSIEKEFMGVSYSVDLIREGHTKRSVSTSYNFVSGDRIQLHLTVNKDGYLYVNHQGTTGAWKNLFPRNNGNGFVKAGASVLIPSNQMMRFDDNPGKESLGLILSAIPLPEMQTPQQNTQSDYKQNIYQTASYTGCGSKDLLLEGGEGDINQVKQQCGSKDLVIEDDTNSLQPASYVVAPVNSLQRFAPIIVPITLTHN